MAANIFGKRLHSDVNAVSKGVKIDSRGPGVVQHYQGAVAVSGFGDDGYVLDFHGHGAGILTPDHARVGAEVSRKGSTGVERIVADVNAEAAQNMVGKFAVRAVNIFRDEHVVSGLEQRQMDKRNGALSAGREERVTAAFKLTNSGCEFKGGGRAIESVSISVLPLVPLFAGVSGTVKENG